MSAKLAQALFKQGSHAQALSVARDVLAAKPDDADLQHLAGRAAAALGRRAEAEVAFATAVRLRPDDALFQFRHAGILYDLGDAETAIAGYRRALALTPDFPEALHNLGNVLRLRGDIDEAEGLFARALELRPGFVEAVGNLGQLRLLRGDYARGWEGYEARSAAAAFATAPRPPLPLWRGEPPAGRRILVVWEQGFGDTIQFARFVPRLAGLGAKVTFLVQPALALALDGLKGVKVTARPPELGGFDCWCPVMSLAQRFAYNPAAEPPQPPYLAAAPDKVKRWRRRMPKDRRRVALSWAGNPGHPHDAVRSLSIAALAPLFAVPDTEFFSLQVGPRAAEAAGWPVTDLTPHLKSFADTAAALCAMDLLIAVDTGTVHLAGALGVPTWVLLCKPCDWRWALTHPDSSPWYPSLRLFRQETSGDWAAPLARVAAELPAAPAIAQK